MERAEFEARLAAWTQAMEAHLRRTYEGSPNANPAIDLMRGPKYIRVVSATWGQRSCFCFLDYEGKIYKSAGWKAPAKHVRGSIFDDNFSIGKGIGTYGAAYLR